jgi:hypothetical protein
MPWALPRNNRVSRIPSVGHDAAAAAQSSYAAVRHSPRLHMRWPSVRSPWAVTAIVLFLYAAWLAGSFATRHDVRDFIVLGRPFVLQSHASRSINYDPHYGYTLPAGYDGQFFYYIAVDPVNARYYTDDPAYRYMRILYPLLARALALGQTQAIPYALIAINWIAIAGGTLVVGLWLKQRGRSPWFALVYGLYPGLFIGLQRDLSEPLAYALVALAIYFFDFGGPRRILWSGISFALAALTRETTVLFAFLYGGTLLVEHISADHRRVQRSARWRDLALLWSLAMGPLLAYRVFLSVWLGSSNVPNRVWPELVPFHGLFAEWPWTPFVRLEASLAILSVVVPALVCAAVAVWALRKGVRRVEVWALLGNFLLFVVLLNSSSYFDVYATQRVSAGVMLSALFCLPWFDRVTKRNHTWLLVATVFWLVPAPLLLLTARTASTSANMATFYPAAFVVQSRSAWPRRLMQGVAPESCSIGSDHQMDFTTEGTDDDLSSG